MSFPTLVKGTGPDLELLRARGTRGSPHFLTGGGEPLGKCDDRCLKEMNELGRGSTFLPL